MEAAATIADAVVAWFDGARVAQKKHAASEWTVLAGVVLTVGDPEAETVRVLATGTGTKCLGRRDLDADGLVVNDCHAEIVARRALRRYLYQEALHWAAADGDPGTAASSIFTRDPTSAKLRLKPRHALHLYISEAPCGDAAIYPLQDAVVDALVERRTQREATAEGTVADPEARSALRLTGAKHRKRPREAATELQDKRFEQAMGIARVKSGRSDLPPDKQTLSMSCSDKIATWVVHGLQGKLLSRWFESLRLASIVVAEDPTAHSRAAQHTALARALCGRLKNPHDAIELCVLPSATASTRFSHQRSAGKNASSLSLNWTRREPHWAKPSGGATKSWRAAFFGSEEIEVLMAATGFKEGAKKAAKMDTSAKQRVASRLSKWSLFRAYDEVARREQDKDRESTVASPSSVVVRTYGEEKEFVVGDKDVATTKAALGEWVGVPVTFKSFHHHVE